MKIIYIIYIFSCVLVKKKIHHPQRFKQFDGGLQEDFVIENITTIDKMIDDYIESTQKRKSDHQEKIIEEKKNKEQIVQTPKLEIKVQQNLNNSHIADIPKKQESIEIGVNVQSKNIDEMQKNQQTQDKTPKIIQNSESNLQNKIIDQNQKEAVDIPKIEHQQLPNAQQQKTAPQIPSKIEISLDPNQNHQQNLNTKQDQKQETILIKPSIETHSQENQSQAKIANHQVDNNWNVDSSNFASHSKPITIDEINKSLIQDPSLKSPFMGGLKPKSQNQQSYTFMPVFKGVPTTTAPNNVEFEDLPYAKKYLKLRMNHQKKKPKSPGFYGDSRITFKK